MQVLEIMQSMEMEEIPMSDAAAAVAVAKVLDARGLNCPLPILKAKKAIGELASGQVLQVLSTDPGSVNDFASFCSQTGNALLSSREASGAYEFQIRKA
jgi:tRNA 2-thiouridine synthesizing protein A